MESVIMESRSVRSDRLMEALEEEASTVSEIEGNSVSDGSRAKMPAELSQLLVDNAAKTAAPVFTMNTQNDQFYEEPDRRIAESERSWEESLHSSISRDDTEEINDIEVDRQFLASDLERSRNEVIESRDTIADLKAELIRYRTENEVLQNDKVQLQDQVDSQKSRLEQQKHRMSVATKQSEEAKRQQRNGTGKQYRLELENQRLRCAVEELEENEQELVAEIENISQERSDAEKANADLSATCNDVLQKLDEASTNIAMLEREKIAICDAEARAQKELQTKLEDAEMRHRRQLDQVTEELYEARENCVSLKSKINEMEGDTIIAKLQTEVGNLRAEMERYKLAEEVHVKDREQLERDVSFACHAVEVSKKENHEAIIDAVAKERAKLRNAEALLGAGSQREEELLSTCNELEQQKDLLEERLRRAEERNLLYEHDHGVDEVARYQKKLEADIKRRDDDLADLHCRLGKEIDKNKVLETACRMMKDDAGSGGVLDDVEVKEAMNGFQAQAKLRIAELEKQVEGLEDERLELLRKLREKSNNERGKARFLRGLSAEQLMRVEAYVATLRCDARDDSLPESSSFHSKEVNNAHERGSHVGNQYQNEHGANGQLSMMKELMQQMREDNTCLRNEIVQLSSNITKPCKNTLPVSLRKKAEDILGEPVENELLVARLIDAYEKVSVDLERALVDTCVLKGKDGSKTKEVEQAACTMIIGINDRDDNEVSSATPCVAPVTTEGNSLLKLMLSKQGDLNFDKSQDKFVAKILGELTTSIEQLAICESELNESNTLIRRYETQIDSVGNQISALNKALTSSREKELNLKDQIQKILAERDDLAVQVKSHNEIIQKVINGHTEGHCDDMQLRAALCTASKRVALHEVNESQLARKCKHLTEQLKLETKRRVDSDTKFIQSRDAPKKRILYLEQWKEEASQKLKRLQDNLSQSIPMETHKTTVREVERLRKENLVVLQRETDAKLCLIELPTLYPELKGLKEKIQELEIENHKLKTERVAKPEEAKHQKDIDTSKARKEDSESTILDTRFRSELARLKCEVCHEEKRAAIYEKQLAELKNENYALTDTIRKCIERENRERKIAEELDQKCIEMEKKFNHSVSADEAATLRATNLELHEKVNELTNQSKRYKELAGIASSQASSLENLRERYSQEIQNYQEICAHKASKTDDNALIGRLQRQLLVSNQALSDAQAANDSLSKAAEIKDAKLCNLETQIDEMELSTNNARDATRVAIASLTESLTLLAKNGGNSELAWKTIIGELSAPGSPSIMEEAKRLSERVSRHSTESRKQEMELIESGKQRQILEHEKSVLLEEKQILERVVNDMKAVCKDSPEATMKNSLCLLADELRATKIREVCLQQKIDRLLEDNRRFNKKIEALESGKLEAETNRILSEPNLCKSMVLMNDQIDVLLYQLFPLKSCASETSDAATITEAIVVHEQGINPLDKLDGSLSAPEKKDLEQLVSDYRTRCADLEAELNEMNSNHIQSTNGSLSASEKKEFEQLVSDYRARCSDLETELRDIKSSHIQSNSKKSTPLVESTKGRDLVAEAAYATITSLKRLLHEKNETIAHLRKQRNATQQRQVRNVDSPGSVASDSMYQENIHIIEQLKNATERVAAGRMNETNNVHTTRIASLDEASALIGEREAQIRLLHLNMQQKNGKLGVAYEEMERMKSDLEKVTSQLTAAEDRMAQILVDRSTLDKASDLKHELRQAEAQRNTLRKKNIALRAKLKATEEETHDREKQRSDALQWKTKLGQVLEELSVTKRALTAAKSSKSKCYRALEGSQARAKEALDDVSCLQDEVSRLRKAAADALHDKENLARKARGFVAKLKELKKATHDEKSEDKCKIDELQQRVSTLTKQNIALRGSQAVRRFKAEARAKEGSAGSTKKAFSGREDVFRYNEQERRESKLQRRVAWLEKQLRVKSDECEASKNMLLAKHARMERVADRRCESKKDPEDDLLYARCDMEEKGYTRDEKSAEMLDALKREIRMLRGENIRLRRERTARPISHETVTQYSSSANAYDSAIQDEKLSPTGSVRKSSMGDALQQIHGNSQENAASIEPKETHHQRQVEDLRTKLERALREKDKLQMSLDALVSERNQIQKRSHQIESKNKELHRQNKKLAKELEVFDVDFFDEIEDLKHRYNEAMQRLQCYESTNQ